MMTNERPTEIENLLSFLKVFPPGYTLIDVGCRGATYTQLLPTHDGVDVLPEPREDIFFNSRFVGNFVDLNLKKYDVTICVSAIEHAGITSYKEFPLEARHKLFNMILLRSNNGFFISAPFGYYMHPGEFEALSPEEVDLYVHDARIQGFSPMASCYHRTENDIWLADSSVYPYDKTRGVESIVIIEGYRNVN